uniref:OmpA-OmpF porin, OOP family n=1 Tax=Candidatus Kentrum sp. LFY TaxID=2126342 RepID=A0A450UMR7_9GAMM|nr:MAG: OmpA-OmpF porin, OOP family [Candidatus Kentron sp. LFY]
MKSLRNILLILLIPLIVSGCATINGKTNVCKIVGGVVGGTAGGFIAEEAIAGVIPGVIAGAILGHILCTDEDADGDGVLDGRDLCPNTPKDATVDKNGCSDPDKDGVFGRKDQCPNTRLGAKVDSKGCGICEKMIANLQGDIYFDSAKCDLDAKAKATLDGMVKTLKDIDANVYLAGYTDHVGSGKVNLTLSQCRASSVKRYLVSGGVNDKITAKGKGEAFPIASTETGKAKNRVVKITATCK